MGTTDGQAIRFVLVEDHAATRAEFVQLFERFHPRIDLVAAFPDAESLLASLGQVHFQVAAIDLGLPGLSGVEVIKRLLEVAPHVRPIALTAFDDERTICDAIRAGAYGYLLKDEPEERLVSAIEEAAAGAHPVSSRVAGFLIARARRCPPPVALSDREEELAQALADGLSYAQCASTMGIAMGTVQDYVKRLYRKLEVNSRKEVREWVERHMDIRH